MGRPSKTRRLVIRMNGDMVGTWTLTATDDHVFTYDPAWTDSTYARPISLSMPFLPGNASYRGAVVESFFDNLLPDSLDIRRRLQARSRHLPREPSISWPKPGGIAWVRCKSLRKGWIRGIRKQYRQSH